MKNSNVDIKMLKAVLREMDKDIEERAKELRDAETRLSIAKDNRARLYIATETLLEEEL